MDLIQRCRESAEASAPEDAQFKEHNSRIEALNRLLHATLDKAKRCENPGQLDETTTKPIPANAASGAMRNLNAMD